MQVSELNGVQLAGWVAKACGYEIHYNGDRVWCNTDFNYHSNRWIMDWPLKKDHEIFAPHKEWVQLGLLIDRFDICFHKIDGVGLIAYVHDKIMETQSSGKNRNIAACRAIVKSVFGDEVKDDVLQDGILYCGYIEYENYNPSPLG